MPPLRISYHHGHRSFLGEERVQAFQAREVKKSRRILPTRRFISDTVRTVLMKDLHRVFGYFLHIEEANGSRVPLLSEPLHPRRVEIRPNQTLSVIYPPSSDLRSLDTLQEHLLLTYSEDDDGDDNWDGDFSLTARNSSDMDHVLKGYSTKPTDPSISADLFPAVETATHTTTNSAMSAPYTSSRRPPYAEENCSSISQAVQIFRFSLPPSPLHLPSRSPTDDACLKMPRLDSTPQELTEPRSTVPQHLFILPMDWKVGTQINRMKQFKLFRMCVCGPNDPDHRTWTPHLFEEPRLYIKRPQQYIALFASTLLLGTRMFFASLRIPLEVASSSSISPSPLPSADPHPDVELIQKELELSGAGEVGSLLEQMIKYLEEVLSPRQGVTDSQSSLMSRHPILERSRLSLSHMALLPMYVDHDRPESPSAYLTFDEDGNDLWVCHSHYCSLNPKSQRKHINDTVEPFGRFDAATGTIDIHLRDPRSPLTRICEIAATEASGVTVLNVASETRLSPQQLVKLVGWAKRLGLTTLSMTGTGCGAGRSSLQCRSRSSVAEDMNEVKEILLHTASQLSRVSIIWDSDLDASALLQYVSPLRDDLLYLRIKTSRSEVSSVMIKDDLGVRHVVSDLGELPLKSKGSILAGKVHNLTIEPCVFSTDDDRTDIWRATLLKIIQENSALMSLTINCKAQDFRTTFDILRSILDEVHNSSIFRQSIRFITLKDTQNDTIARFNLAPLPNERRELVDVTAGAIEQAHYSVLLNFGAFIRVLNVLDDIAESTGFSSAFACASPTHLVSLMLALTTFSYQSAQHLSSITISSKNTLKQLILIGHPKDYDTLQSLLSTIQWLHGCDVLVTQTGPMSMKTWIEPALRAIRKSSRLFVVETSEEARLMVPELSTSGFALLKGAFDRSKRFNVELTRHSNSTMPDGGFDSKDDGVDPLADNVFVEVVENVLDGNPVP